MGALLLGITDLVTAILVMGMFVYFLSIKGNGLKSILCHLFLSWGGRYIVIGSITLASYLVGYEIESLNTLRIITTFFVVLEFAALYRLYRYIVNNYGKPA